MTICTQQIGNATFICWKECTLYFKGRPCKSKPTYVAKLSEAEEAALLLFCKVMKVEWIEHYHAEVDGKSCKLDALFYSDTIFIM